jgi:hypothetical protein
MSFRNTLLIALALCSPAFLCAQGNSGKNQIDPTALAAVQYTFSQQFGPGTTCKFPDTAGLCLAVITFTGIPTGQRLVITDISAVLSFNPNGSPDAPAGALSFGVNVAGTVAFYNFPWDRSVQVGNLTTYYLNKNLHMFADPGIGFPEILIENLTGIGPIFNAGTGAFGITITGYLVPTT